MIKIIRFLKYFFIYLLSFIIAFVLSFVIENSDCSYLIYEICSKYCHNLYFLCDLIFCFLYTLLFIVSLIFFYLKKMKKLILIDAFAYLGFMLGTFMTIETMMGI